MSSEALTILIAVPLLGGVIGYVTNRIAVKMIFRPIEPTTILGFRFQGLVPRRQQDLAESIGRIVGEHLVSHDDVLRCFEKVDLEHLIGDVLERGLAPKIEELRKMPLIGGFLNDDRVKDLRDSVLRGILKHKDMLFEKLEDAVTQGLDVRKVVSEKVAAFHVETLERLVLEVASRELRSIERLGAVLGVLIGLVQAALLLLL